mmetsp:Transcript_70898/g.162583  ORF Transcript_70898/g.162583 Transcript_70898/m.162583 type:complete len:99 (+) Transcript_70898:314-610(+)
MWQLHFVERVCRVWLQPCFAGLRGLGLVSFCACRSAQWECIVSGGFFVFGIGFVCAFCCKAGEWACHAGLCEDDRAHVEFGLRVVRRLTFCSLCFTAW